MIHSNITAIVLAAGASRRMGAENKLFLPFGKQTLLETTLSHIEAAGLGEILVVVGYEKERVYELLKNKPFKMVENPDYARGMTTSIQAGIAEARPDSEGFMICLSDMPLIAAAAYLELAEIFAAALASDPAAIVQPQYKGQPGNPVLFSGRYRHDLLALQYPEGAKPLVAANREHLVRAEMHTEAILLDADTPEAYQLLLSRPDAGFI